MTQLSKNPLDIHITKKQYDYYSYLNIFINFLYFTLIFGVAFVNATYVHYVIVFIHVLICLFLLAKFNRFVSGGVFIQEYEKKFIFSGAAILLLNIFIYEVGISLKIDKIKEWIEIWKSKLFTFINVK